MGTLQGSHIVTGCKRAFRNIFSSLFSLYSEHFRAKQTLCIIRCNILVPFDTQMVTFHLSMNLFL